MAQEVMTSREQAVDYLTFLNGTAPTEEEIQQYLNDCEEFDKANVENEYSMCNGFAACPKFTSTEDDAISDCVKDSMAMNTRNWLYKIVDGKQEEIGHTEKFGPLDWKFISKVN